MKLVLDLQNTNGDYMDCMFLSLGQVLMVVTRGELCSLHLPRTQSYPMQLK